jgi:hypothetical protein
MQMRAVSLVYDVHSELRELPFRCTASSLDCVCGVPQVYGLDNELCVSLSGYSFYIEVCVCAVPQVYGLDNELCVSLSGYSFYIEVCVCAVPQVYGFYHAYVCCAVGT